MIVSGHALCYLPWLGLFEKIGACDVFVCHDTAQFGKKSFLNRNRIRTPQGSMWLTVPVDLNDYLDKELREIEIKDDLPWRERHWTSISYNYRRAPYWKSYQARLEAVYARPWKYLLDLNIALVRWAMAELRIETELRMVSELQGVSGQKSDFVLSVCRSLGASVYYSGDNGGAYLHLEDFAAAGIEVMFQEYQHPSYPQRFDDFVPYLSILDLLMNCGPSSREICLSGGHLARSGRRSSSR